MHQELQSLTLRSLKVLADLMEDADPIVRLRAARTVAAMASGQWMPVAFATASKLSRRPSLPNPNRRSYELTVPSSRGPRSPEEA